ncbi:MAG: glycosyltransferase family 39 protein [Pirellulales bacterium]
MDDKDPLVVPLAPDAGSWWREWEVAALVVLVAAVYFTRLATVPVCGEESRWASAAREMIASGDWIVPRQQGAIFPERPPLGSWAIALVGALRGHVDLVAIRLPSALATLALVLVIYAYARSWMSRLGSFAAAAMYATFGQVLQLGRLGESEALFTLFTGGALLVWHGGYRSGRSRAATWCWGYSLAALGALVKGPQAPVYFVGACVVYLMLKRDWRWLVSRGHALGVLALAAIVGAWLVPFAASNWQAVDDICAGLAQDRFTTHRLARHLATYPFETFGCLLPWSPLLIALVKPSVLKSILATRPEVKFLLVAIVVTYPSVWLAAEARGRYYMPLYPCLAVLTGLVVEHCTARGASLADRLFWQRFLRVLALVVLGCGAAVVVASLSSGGRLAEAAQPRPFLLLWVPGVLVAAGLLAWASLGDEWPRPQLGILTLAAFLGLAQSGAMINARLRAANDLDPAIARLKQRLADCELVSLGRVYHRFAYAFDAPIRQIPWPAAAADLPRGVTYFCFDRRPNDTAVSRSTSDGRLSGKTPGTLPFEWDEVARIDCDPVHRQVYSRTVVIGRVRRGETVALPGSNRPGHR